jgi:hypothetical protein
VAFSGKGRSVCPSCNGRHMAQTAAHLADYVIPPVPVRQWVISVPKRLRGFLADRQSAIAALTKIFLAEIEQHLLVATGGAPDAEMPRASRPRLGGISPATALARRSITTCTCIRSRELLSGPRQPPEAGAARSRAADPSDNASGSDIDRAILHAPPKEFAVT